MRPEGRMRAGFYACPPKALSVLLRRLKQTPQDGPGLTLLDPCAGAGEALGILAKGLGVPGDRTWMVELDGARGDQCRNTIPGSSVLAPASFLQTSIRHNCFSLVYTNCPFDDSLAKGRRVEELFLSRAVDLVADGGLLVFVCPAYVTQLPGIRDKLLPSFGEFTILEWPDDVRGNGEVFLIAKKGELLLWGDKARAWHTEMRRGERADYTLPPAKGPGARFTKTGFTDDELADLLGKSPLQAHLKVLPEYKLPSPPLALGVGHLALLLSAGHLDGLVAPPGERPHVVRGTAKKVLETIDETVDKSKSQTVTTKIQTERIRLTVRAVWPDGVIHTLE